MIPPLLLLLQIAPILGNPTSRRIVGNIYVVQGQDGGLTASGN